MPTICTQAQPLRRVDQLLVKPDGITPTLGFDYVPIGDPQQLDVLSGLYNNPMTRDPSKRITDARLAMREFRDRHDAETTALNLPKAKFALSPRFDVLRNEREQLAPIATPTWHDVGYPKEEWQVNHLGVPNWNDWKMDLAAMGFTEKPKRQHGRQLEFKPYNFLRGTEPMTFQTRFGHMALHLQWIEQVVRMCHALINVGVADCLMVHGFKDGYYRTESRTVLGPPPDERRFQVQPSGQLIAFGSGQYQMLGHWLQLGWNPESNLDWPAGDESKHFGYPNESLEVWAEAVRHAVWFSKHTRPDVEIVLTALLPKILERDFLWKPENSQRNEQIQSALGEAALLADVVAFPTSYHKTFTLQHEQNLRWWRFIYQNAKQKTGVAP